MEQVFHGWVGGSQLGNQGRGWGERKLRAWQFPRWTRGQARPAGRPTLARVRDEIATTARPTQSTA